MLQPKFLSVAEQLAAYLRNEILRRRWIGSMPGMNQLAAEFGVDDKTVEVALRQLEHEGFLMAQGQGRRRLISTPSADATRSLRVAILLSEPEDRKVDYMVELQHMLADAGHVVFYPQATLRELGMDVARIARMVGKTPADAWVVVSASREVLEWFSKQPEPAIAFAGRARKVPIAVAGPDKLPALISIVRQLVAHGHQRIVLLVRTRRRLPEPGAFERAFLDELRAHGISASTYNLPHWEETIEDFHKRLESLFQLTPPTALIVDEAPFMLATLQFLLKWGLQVPQDVSLVCTDGDPTFAWCQPSMAHIHWDSRLVLQRVVRWAANVSRQKQDLRQTLTKAEFVPGGTIGPAR
jgi:DNA-binding transcriptional regulator YhcF (GntR family)